MYAHLFYLSLEITNIIRYKSEHNRHNGITYITPFSGNCDFKNKNFKQKLVNAILEET